MALTLYRRHRRECKAGHKEQSFSSEFEERKRGWTRCECPIVVSGTLQKKFKRHSTNLWEWDAARAIATQFETAGSWDGTRVVHMPQPERPDTSTGRATITDACKVFLDELAETAALATHKKYRLLMARFVKFSEERGYVMIDQWEPMDVRQFRSTWPVSPQTAVRRMAMMKPFFEYCVSNKWIESNPARAVKNPKGREMTHSEQKYPFTDEEIKRMYEACERYGKTYRHKWDGEDLADFISLSIYTGLRISDVALFNIDRMTPAGEIRLRTTKAGTHVYTWVPAWLQERIRARVEKHGHQIFGSHTTKSLDVITEGWRIKLNRIWEMSGPWKEPPHPHRFRHTFARILLQKPGVTVRDVAELLGNTEEIVLKRYSAWVKDRQDRLTKILQEAFDDKPKPKLVSIR
jgi:integrase